MPTAVVEREHLEWAPDFIPDDLVGAQELRDAQTVVSQGRVAPLGPRGARIIQRREALSFPAKLWIAGFLLVCALIAAATAVALGPSDPPSRGPELSRPASTAVVRSGAAGTTVLGSQGSCGPGSLLRALPVCVAGVPGGAAQPTSLAGR